MNRAVRRLSAASLVACAALAAVLSFNALRQGSHQMTVAPLVPRPADAGAAAERLAGAVRLRTISYDEPSAASLHEIRALHAYLEVAFPRTHQVLRREVVNDYSLLYTWTGQDPAEKPIVFMAHQDVVPIAPGSESEWHAGPFSGEIREGFVWGRGAWDDKGNLMAILEAVESLIETGFTPRRTIYLVFGHDEENGGERGAKAVAALFSQRAVHPEFVLDEGLLIADGIMPGLEPPVALIGIAEKGFATLRLTASAPPGHSSMPGTRTAIGSLASALVRIDRAPFGAGVGGVAAQTLAAIAPEMHGLNRVALSNLWLFEPLVRRQLMGTPSGNAMLRTTTAVTVIRGGNKENVLPESAEALVNLRLLPGDTVGGVVAHVREAVGDASVRIDVQPQSQEASPVASARSAAYRTIERTVRELFPGVVVAPGLMIGATDSRHMVPLADNVYRFSPVRARPEDLARFHGTDERISIANYGQMIAFYRTLIDHAAGGR
jgi:carboxypeptidase PM20D1